MTTTTKTRVIAELDRAIVDIRNASQALENDDIQAALAAFESCGCRLAILATELSGASQ